MVNNLPANTGDSRDVSSIPGGGEDSLEEEMATHSSISCLKNFLDRGVWQATVHGVAESNTTKRLSIQRIYKR